MIDFKKKQTEYILYHYGTRSQVMKAIEELTELQIEFWKAIKESWIGGVFAIDKRRKTFEERREKIIGEIADVLVMIGQMQIVFGIDDKDVQAVIDSKIQRTFKRIEDDE